MPIKFVFTHEGGAAPLIVKSHSAIGAIEEMHKIMPPTHKASDYELNDFEVIE
jgi:hypothetical protein